MTVTCMIRYQIDPFQREAFLEYARNWRRIIPRALIAFESLASYETYRARLKTDPEGRTNFSMAQSKRFILREERTFVETVEGTFGVPSAPAAAR